MQGVCDKHDRICLVVVFVYTEGSNHRAWKVCRNLFPVCGHGGSIFISLATAASRGVFIVVSIYTETPMGIAISLL